MEVFCILYVGKFKVLLAYNVASFEQLGPGRQTCKNDGKNDVKFMKLVKGYFHKFHMR